MTERVRRNQTESNKKLQKMAKDRKTKASAPGPRFRNTPAGRKLAALEKAKHAAEAAAKAAEEGASDTSEE